MSQESDSELVKRLNFLKKDRDDLIQRKFKISAELGAARKSLRSLNEEAERLFGTSDLQELKGILIKNREENTKAVDDLGNDVLKFKESITSCESSLKSLSS